MQKKRELKVYESNGTYGPVTPVIRLQGKWLRECGFEIGDQIKVKCEKGKLVVGKQ